MTDATPEKAAKTAPTGADKVLERQIARRRTFAIISHPDAGKTTMTEKLLLYGGAIRQAGSVKARRAARHATSDWMELEKQRGISVTSSAMQFDYGDYRINILDTPGHQDFSEDTYRTLAAADAAVMLIDAAKGVEPQTEKLFRVCKLRGIPVFTFVNKMDRHGRDPLDLMEELNEHLGMPACPMNWPVYDGSTAFRGVYDREGAQVHLFESTDHGAKEAKTVIAEPADDRVLEALGDDGAERLAEDLELLDVAGDELNVDRVLAGELSPMFFGSALTNFGIELFLQQFLKLAPPPSPHPSSVGMIEANRREFTAFVFKIQANMNSSHRDRIAFARICSGKFNKGMEVFHPRMKRKIRLSNPSSFMASERSIIEEAYAGDIVGLYDPGIFRVGDSLCQGKDVLFGDIPHFSPELFRRVRVVKALQRKQLVKGLDQLTEEGAIQVFADFQTEQLDILGAVGTLQFDVLQYRLQHEYNVETMLDPLPYAVCRWIIGDGFNHRTFKRSQGTMLARDRDAHPVLLLNSPWAVSWAEENNPEFELRPVSPVANYAGALAG